MDYSTMSKRMNIAYRHSFFNILVQASFCFCFSFKSNRRYKIPMGPPWHGRQIHWGWRVCNFRSFSE